MADSLAVHLLSQLPESVHWRGGLAGLGLVFVIVIEAGVRVRLQLVLEVLVKLWRKREMSSGASVVEASLWVGMD